ncbi:MAG: hypothetical protein N2053_00005, partial [Chitinispirillaceae bacterium]|nr:hypothetical protein [Chitinispirillaceae bacterium]
VYQREGRWYYWGLASSIGNTEDEYYQMLVLCDQAGNLLYSSKLLKQEISDAVLQYVERTNTNYTVRKAVRHVFVPAVDRRGNIFYGIINFEHKKLEVYKRAFLWYKPQPAKKSIPPQVFEKANLYAYSPVLLDCTEESQDGVFPEITILTDDGIKTLSKGSLVKNGYYITLHRITDVDLKKKLSRVQELLPSNIRKAQDSISKVISAWCPYSISLNHEERGRLNIFHYGPNDELLSARILAVTENSDVLIRVDLEKWAEIIQFDAEGEFVNRFIFNRQDYNIRKDVIVVGKNTTIAEEDYELPKGKKQYLLWKLEIDK